MSRVVEAGINLPDSIEIPAASYALISKLPDELAGLRTGDVVLPGAMGLGLALQDNRGVKSVEFMDVDAKEAPKTAIVTYYDGSTIRGKVDRYYGPWQADADASKEEPQAFTVTDDAGHVHYCRAEAAAPEAASDESVVRYVGPVQTAVASEQPYREAALHRHYMRLFTAKGTADYEEIKAKGVSKIPAEIEAAMRSEGGLPRLDFAPEGVRIETIKKSVMLGEGDKGRGVSVTYTLYIPEAVEAKGEPLDICLHIRGSGFDAVNEMSRNFCGNWAIALGRAVIVIEHDDAMATEKGYAQTLQHLIDAYSIFMAACNQEGGLGSRFKTDDIYMSGYSCGASMVGMLVPLMNYMATLQKVTPAATITQEILFSPTTDYSLGVELGEDERVTKEYMLWAIAMAFGNMDLTHPLVSVLHMPQEILAFSANVLITCGASDVAAPQARAFAQKLQNAGVRVNQQYLTQVGEDPDVASHSATWGNPRSAEYAAASLDRMKTEIAREKAAASAVDTKKTGGVEVAAVESGAAGGAGVADDARRSPGLRK